MRGESSDVSVCLGCLSVCGNNRLLPEECTCCDSVTLWHSRHDYLTTTCTSRHSWHDKKPHPLAANLSTGTLWKNALTWIGHPPCYIAECFLEVLPVHYSDFVRSDAIGTSPDTSCLCVHLSDSITVQLVA